VTAGRQAWLKHTKAHLEIHHRVFIHNQIVQKKDNLFVLYIEKESKQHSISVVIFFVFFFFLFFVSLPFLMFKNANSF